jgi:hypothetical protein
VFLSCCHLVRRTYFNFLTRGRQSMLTPFIHDRLALGLPDLHAPGAVT